MVKRLILAALLVLLPASAHAVATAPETNVWYTPMTAQAGEAIELNAFVYNSTKKVVTATVTFKRDTGTIDTTAVTIQPQTAKVATIHTQKPKLETTITAEVTKAVDAQNQNVPELIGVVGSMQVTGAQKKATIPAKLTLPSEQTIKGWFSALIDKIEPFRLKQADRYTTLKAETRKALRIDEKTDLLDAISEPDAPGVQSDDTVTVGSFSSARQLNIGLYGTYIYATALSGMFSNVAVFYISIVLLTLIVLRYTVGALI